MSKELKILKEIEAIHLSDNVSVRDVASDEIKALNQALKDYLDLQRSYVKMNDIFSQFIVDNSKKLKALKIIKEKEVDVYRLTHYLTLNGYNEGVCILRRLTQEEFDLLKEVLL